MHSIVDGRLTGVTDYGAFAEDEPEVDRLFAAASSQFLRRTQAYNDDYPSKAIAAVECVL